MVFVDASALTAIIVDEHDAEALMERLDRSPSRSVSGVALWETALAVARIKETSLTDAWAEVERFTASLNLRAVAIDLPETIQAIAAQHRYGRGTGHPARLNMGDCFAYACARTNGASLLYKGDDFSHTDLR